MKKFEFAILIFVSMLSVGCETPEKRIDIPQTTANLVDSICIQSGYNRKLKDDICFSKDSNANFFYRSNRWMDSLVFIPTIFADASLYVNGKTFSSDWDKLDFSQRNIELVAVNQQKGQHTYHVSILSPQTTGLPVLNIHIDGGAEVKDRETFLNANCQVYVNGICILDTAAEIRGRGNSTWWYDKKPYRLRFYNKQPMFGMKAARNWVLLANYQDPTLLTNTVGLEIARQMDMEFTNHTQHVELYINGKYRGNYVLTEKIQVNKHRVDVDTLNGGFLAELDANYDEVYKCKTPYYKLPLMMHAPESQQGLNNAATLFQQLEQIISKPNFKMSDYSHLVDVESLAKYIMMTDIVRNVEIGHPKSVFCYRKNASSPLQFGPAWDFDWGFGYAGGHFLYFRNLQAFTFGPDMTYSGTGGCAFFNRFFADPEFVEVYKKVWREVKDNLYQVPTFVETMGEQIEASKDEDALVWGTHDMDFKQQIKRMSGYVECRLLWFNEMVENF